MLTARRDQPGERALSLIQAHYPTYHPLIAIAHLAHRDDVRADPLLELNCHRTIAEYTLPKLKSVEVKAELSEVRRVVVSLFEEEVTDAEILSDAEILRANHLELISCEE